MEQRAPPRAVGDAAGGGLTDAAQDVGPNQDPDTTYAGLVTRVIALALDALLIDAAALLVTGAVLVVISVFSVSGKHSHPVLVVAGSVLFVVWVISYFAVFWTTTGQTVGNRVMQIRVVRSDGARLKPRHALVRLAGMVISLPLFWGYIPILTSARRRGVFDLMADTVVTVVRSSPGTDRHMARFVHTTRDAGRLM
jgi:uncharacterized RDD family membrane protein YckC